MAFFTTGLAASACTVEQAPVGPVDPAIPPSGLVGWRGDAAIVRDVASAADHALVPFDVLLALGWAETRFAVAHEDDAHGEREPPCGFFGLDAGAARLEAARAIGVEPAALCDDVALEARAAALRLRALAGGASAPPLDDLARWYRALDRWHPALAERGFPYGTYVARLARRGFRGTVAGGASVSLPPDLRLVHTASLPAASGDVGVVRAAATPDTDLAAWRGPACDYRAASRVGGDVTYIIIHTCEGGFAGCLSTLTSCGGTEVSAHYVVSYTGERVQAVEENDIGWHVGCLNGPSIGIEHEGYAGADSHPDEQYCASAELVRSICDRWGIPCDRDHVIGHVEANERFCGGSHWDPGPNWDWTKFMGYVAHGCRCTPSPEVCDGVDNDCNGAVDEGVQNACGGCGELPAESCNGADDDCDGAIDEGVCVHARIEAGGLPDALDLGMWSSFSITLVNDGTTPWAAGAVTLIVDGEGAEGTGEVLEHRDVSGGESLPARVRVRAIEERASVALGVSVAIDGVPVDARWTWETEARRPLFGARFVDASVPREVKVGERAEGWVAVVNEGRAAWPAGTLITTREADTGLRIRSAPIAELAPGSTARVSVEVSAQPAVIGETVTRTLVVSDPDGEQATWPAAERVVSVLVTAADGSVERDADEDGVGDMMRGGCASTTGAPDGVWMAVLLGIGVIVFRRRRG